MEARCYQALVVLLPECNPARTQWASTGSVLLSFPFPLSPQGHRVFALRKTKRPWLAAPSAWSPTTPPACGPSVALLEQAEGPRHSPSLRTRVDTPLTRPRVTSGLPSQPYPISSGGPS